MNEERIERLIKVEITVFIQTLMEELETSKDSRKLRNALDMALFVYRSGEDKNA